MMVDGWTIIAGRSLVARANGGLSDHVTKPWEGPSSLIKPSPPPSIHCRKRDIGWEGSYIPVYIHAHDQRIRLEAADCELRHAICISVTINLWWEET